MKLVSSFKFFVTNSSSDVYALDLNDPQFDFKKLVQAERVLLALARDKNLLEKAVAEALKMLSNDEVLSVAYEVLEADDYKKLLTFVHLGKLSSSIDLERIQKSVITLGLNLQTDYPQDGDGSLYFEGLLYDLIVESVVRYFDIPTKSKAGYGGTRLYDLPIGSISQVFNEALKKYEQYKLFAFIHEDGSYGELVLPKTKNETLLQILSRNSKLKKEFEEFRVYTVDALKYQSSRIGFYADKDNLLWIITDITSDFSIHSEVHNEEFEFIPVLLKMHAV